MLHVHPSPLGILSALTGHLLPSCCWLLGWFLGLVWSLRLLAAGWLLGWFLGLVWSLRLPVGGYYHRGFLLPSLDSLDAQCCCLLKSLFFKSTAVVTSPWYSPKSFAFYTPDLQCCCFLVSCPDRTPRKCVWRRSAGSSGFIKRSQIIGFR